MAFQFSAYTKNKINQMHSNLWIDAGCPALDRFLISRKCPFEFNDRIRATHL